MNIDLFFFFSGHIFSLLTPASHVFISIFTKVFLYLPENAQIEALS